MAQETESTIGIGDHVIYVDPKRKGHHGLVTAIHGEAHWGPDQRAKTAPSINLVFVSPDDDRADHYGRQVERATSIVHQEQQEAEGLYWYQP